MTLYNLPFGPRIPGPGTNSSVTSFFIDPAGNSILTTGYNCTDIGVTAGLPLGMASRAFSAMGEHTDLLCLMARGKWPATAAGTYSSSTPETDGSGN